MSDLYYIPFYGGHSHLKVEKLPLKREIICAVPMQLDFVSMSEHWTPSANSISFEEDRYTLREIIWPGIQENWIEQIWESWYVYVLNNDEYFLEEIIHHWDLFLWMGYYGRY